MSESTPGAPRPVSDGGSKSKTVTVLDEHEPPSVRSERGTASLVGFLFLVGTSLLIRRLLTPDESVEAVADRVEESGEVDVIAPADEESVTPDDGSAASDEESAATDRE